MVATMNPTAINRALQMELDLEIDRARLARNNWQRALECNLHALQDYVHSDKLIIWQPGNGGTQGESALEVQISSATSCTCQRHRLRGNCHHTAFAERLEATGTMPDMETPVRAREIEGSEVAA